MYITELPAVCCPIERPVCNQPESRDANSFFAAQLINYFKPHCFVFT